MSGKMPEVNILLPHDQFSSVQREVYFNSLCSPVPYSLLSDVGREETLVLDSCCDLEKTGFERGHIHSDYSDLRTPGSEVKIPLRVFDEEIFEYRLPIGLALMAIDTKEDDLNLFNRLYQPFGEEDKKHWLYSTKITGAIAAAALLLCVAVWYTVDAVKADSIRNRIETPESGINLNQLVEKQKILQKIESERR